MRRRPILPTLSPHRRRDLLRLPGLSRWAKLALQRERVEIDCRLDGLDLAIQQKLNPEIGAWRYHADRPAGQRIERFNDFKPGQALKKRATLALRDATRTPRPRRYRNSEITAVMNNAHFEIVNAARVDHHRRSLTPDEYTALRVDLSTCRSRADLRDVVTEWLKRS